MSKKAFLFTLSIVVSGCSSNIFYSKQGVSQVQMDRDAYQCAQESQVYKSSSTLTINSLGGVGSSSGGHKTDGRLFTMCMRAKGYQVSDKPITNHHPSAYSQKSYSDKKADKREVLESRKAIPGCQDLYEFPDGYSVCLD